MIEPTPRQQAGYLRRLLRRGAIVVVDAESGAVVPTAVEIDGSVIRLHPSRGIGASADPASEHWVLVLERLRKSMTLAEAEELVTAVETERAQTPAAARSYMPQST